MKSFVMGLTLLAIACGETVNVGYDDVGDPFGEGQLGEIWTDGTTSQIGDPVTIYQGTSAVVAFTVDEENVYMLMDVRGKWRTRLDTCPSDRCGTERRTLVDIPQLEGREATPAGVVSPTKLIVAAGTLYWTGEIDSPPNTLLACEIRGCPEGPERVRVGSIVDIASDGEFVYLLLEDRSILRRRHGRGTVIEQVSSGVLPARPSINYGDSLINYGDSLYFVSRSEIVRVIKSGFVVQEVISGQINIADAAVGTRGVCFLKRVLTGGLFCCPHTGCTGEPEPLIASQRWPVELVMDDSDVFWMTDAGPDSTTNDKSTLSRCALPDCAAPAVISRDVSLYYPKGERNEFTRALALNTSFVFWFDTRAYRWLDQVRVAAR